MVRMTVEGGGIVVRLSPWAKFWAFHRDLRVPLSGVRRVEVPANPWAELRGWRAAGTSVQGLVSLGTRRHGTGRDFVALVRQRPAVQVHMNSGPYERLLVSVEEAEEMAARVADGAGIKR